jgi:transposase
VSAKGGGCGLFAYFAGVKRYELTDAQWRRLEPLLPPERPRTGRPNHSHRTLLNGILWILRTGAPWRDLPERYGPVGTVSSRFSRWRKAEIWQRVLETLQADADAAGLLDRDLHFVDASVVRAHQHAAGARRAGAIRREGLGRSRGGFSTKIHVRAEGYGKPVPFHLTGGERHDSIALPALLDAGAVRRKQGRPRLRPRRVVGDKAFAGQPSRQHLRSRRIGAVIPAKKGERRRPRFDREAYRARNRVEMVWSQLTNSA